MSSNVEPSVPVLDRDELIERMMGSVQMAERMLGKFLDASPSECDALESTARMGDTAELLSLAHRHKGTAKTMSAPRVAVIAEKLEQKAGTDATSELLELIDELRIAHGEFRQAVEQQFSRFDGADPQ